MEKFFGTIISNENGVCGNTRFGSLSVRRSPRITGKDTEMRRLLLALMSLSAVHAVAGSDGGLFVSGYPPAVDSASVEGSPTEIVLRTRKSLESAFPVFDSRFKTTAETSPLATEFSSLPVAFCITIR